MSGPDVDAPKSPEQPPRLLADLSTWAAIGWLSFGGPTAQIALMHRVLVEERGWLTEKQFLGALSFCMLLPGPEAMQLATYAGWRRAGIAGGLLAGGLFVLPGALVILALAATYGLLGEVPLVQAVFLGVKAAVVVIVIEALLRIAKRALQRVEHWVIAGIAFVAITGFGAPFPAIIAAAALVGLATGSADDGPTPDPAAPDPVLPSPIAALRTASIWLALWMLPLVTLTMMLGSDHVLSGVGWFFSKLAVVTFGGAYSVLAYMAQDVVTQQRWLTAGQMMDGLGLAETTPGPLILVTEFVGFLARLQSGSGASWGTAVAAAGVTLWVTFIPCFLWIFTGAPYIEWINSRHRLRAALAAITAAVVGVILNLSLWFALHVFFAAIDPVSVGPVSLLLPDSAALDWRALSISALAGVLLLVRHWGIPAALLVSASAAGAMHLLLPM